MEEMDNTYTYRGQPHDSPLSAISCGNELALCVAKLQRCVTCVGWLLNGMFECGHKSDSMHPHCAHVLVLFSQEWHLASLLRSCIC